MKRLILALALAASVTNATAAVPEPVAAGANEYEVFVGPTLLHRDATYLVTHSGDATVMTYFADAKDCRRFAPDLSGTCLSGDAIMKRAPVLHRPKPNYWLDIIFAGIYCGGLYALWRVCLTVFYPFVSGALWQNVIGPRLVKRWPDVAQRDDKTRPSYLPMRPDDPEVISLGLFPPPIDDVTHGIRDGLLLGLLCTLIPELGLPGFLTFILGVVMLKNIWRFSTADGAVATDRFIWGFREILMYVGVVVALRSTEFLR